MKAQKGHRLRKLMIIFMIVCLRDAEHKLKTKKKQRGDNNPPSRTISTILISTRNTIMPPDSLEQL